MSYGCRYIWQKLGYGKTVRSSIGKHLPVGSDLVNYYFM